MQLTQVFVIYMAAEPAPSPPARGLSHRAAGYRVGAQEQPTTYRAILCVCLFILLASVPLRPKTERHGPNDSKKAGRRRLGVLHRNYFARLATMRFH
jgi:hypothetical protein